MLDTTKLTTQENIFLSEEITVVAPLATPLMTLLLGKGKQKQGSAKIHTWREKSLDFGDATILEGADAKTFVNSTRAELNNVMEIFAKATAVSGTAQATGSVKDLFSSEIEDRLAEVKVAIEKKLIQGVKNDGSNGKARTMDGLEAFVGTTLTAVASIDKLTEKDVRGLARALFENGNENAEIYVLVSPDVKEQIDELYKANYSYEHKTNDFGIVVSSINTNYGVMNFVVDRYAKDTKVIAFDLNAVGIAFLREPQFEELGKTGDSIKGQVVAEATLEVGSKKAVVALPIGV